MSPVTVTGLLHHLARLYGIQTAYYDVHHHRRQASTESLLAILRSLGAPITALTDVPRAWRERRQAIWQRLLEPVIIARDDEPAVIQVRLPSGMAEALLNFHVKLESGEQRSWERSGTSLPAVETAEIEGIRYVVKQLRLPIKLPWGYHRLTMELPGRLEESLLISAPSKAYIPQAEQANRNWGVFLPLYALHTEKSWGSGDFSALEELIDWLGERGGEVVATLPLLPTFFHGASEPSPYLPASRLLWNEFYLDVNKIPGLPACPPAQALLASSPFQNEIKALRNLTLVDYPRQMSLKRQVLQELSGYFFAQESRLLADFRHFIEENPVVEDYARFRAIHEKQGTSWRFWPQLLQHGTAREGDYDEKNRQYHVYVQWLAHQQMKKVSDKAKEKASSFTLTCPWASTLTSTICGVNVTPLFSKLPPERPRTPFSRKARNGNSPRCTRKQSESRATDTRLPICAITSGTRVFSVLTMLWASTESSVFRRVWLPARESTCVTRLTSSTPF